MIFFEKIENIEIDSIFKGCGLLWAEISGRRDFHNNRLNQRFNHGPTQMRVYELISDDFHQFLSVKFMLCGPRFLSQIQLIGLLKTF